MMKKQLFFLIGILICLFSSMILASVKVKIYATTGHPPQYFGTIVFENSKQGLLIKPNLRGLSPGLHGFHVHDNPECANQGEAAGGHYDPKHSQKHLGPYSKEGELGDLPVLFVNQQGIANKTMLAPRLIESDLYGRAIMIHEHGDNYSDFPKKLGGGGARIACGVIKKPVNQKLRMS